MRRFFQILIVIVVLVIVYFLASGLGLTRRLKHPKETKVMKVINDFEYERYDYEWTTNGYGKMEPSTENPVHGKRCAKVTFFLPSQFMATPSAAASWVPQLILDTRSITKLDVYDWTGFTTLNLDVLNPQDKPVSYFIRIADSHTFTYDHSDLLTSKKVTNIAIPLEELIDKRLDLANIRSFKFWVDTTGATLPVIVYLDYLRLEQEKVAQPKKR
jgi:hypothetical protein